MVDWTEIFVAIIGVTPVSLLVSAYWDKRSNSRALSAQKSHLEFLEELSIRAEELEARGVKQLADDILLFRSTQMVADSDLLEASRRNEKTFKKNLFSASLSAVLALAVLISSSHSWLAWVLIICFVGLTSLGVWQVVECFKTISRTQLEAQAKSYSKAADELRKWQPGRDPDATNKHMDIQKILDFDF